MNKCSGMVIADVVRVTLLRGPKGTGVALIYRR